MTTTHNRDMMLSTLPEGVRDGFLAFCERNKLEKVEIAKIVKEFSDRVDGYRIQAEAEHPTSGGNIGCDVIYTSDSIGAEYQQHIIIPGGNA